MAESDVVVLLVDGRVGVQPGDRDVLEWLRTHHPRKQVILAVNKCDNAAKADLAASEFWELGLEPRPISAINGFGTGDMLDALVKVRVPGSCRTCCRSSRCAWTRHAAHAAVAGAGAAAAQGGGAAGGRQAAGRGNRWAPQRR